MRLTLSDKKDKVVNFVYVFLKTNLIGENTKTIVNGEESRGVIQDVLLDEDKLDYIKIKINDEVFKIPFNDNSKANFNKKLLYLETDSHTTLIEVMHQ